MGRLNTDLLGVFDGHAGSAAARFAAKQFSIVLEDNLKHKDPIESLTVTFSEVNSQFRTFIKTQDLGVKHSGTTALVSLIIEQKLYVANLGDSRGVLCRGGKAVRLSWDHKPMLEEDRINALGGYVIGGQTRRINGMVAVSRSIGDFFMEPFIIDDPYVSEFDLTPEDQFLILACDGVWDELSDQAAVDICLSEKDPLKAALKLRDTAYSLGSEDNISVIVLVLN